MRRARNQHAEITLAKMRAELAAAHAENARLNAELTELRLNPPLARRASALLPGDLTDPVIASLIKKANQTGERLQQTDCDNLVLQIIPGRKKTSVSWLFRWSERVTVGKNKHKSRCIGFGTYPNVDIGHARELAMHNRRLLQQGKDPQIEREKLVDKEYDARDAFKKTVNEVMNIYFAKKIAPLSISTRRKVDALFRPVRENIGSQPIHNLTLEILLSDTGCGIQRMWEEKHKSAVELVSHLRRMISLAKSMGKEGNRWFKGENPAIWRDNLEHHLPKSRHVHTVVHRPSLSYPDMPYFIQQLNQWRYRKTWHLAGLQGHPIPAYAVKLLAITGVRTKEVQRARFNEFDLVKMVWKVPGFDADGTRRTKNGEDHYLPITPTMVAIIEEMEKVRVHPVPDAFLFPALRERYRGKAISPVSMQTLSRLLRQHLKLDVKFVNHGFRTTLRGWVSANKYPDEWWKIQVGKLIGDRTSQAYPFGEQFEGRREMMQRYDAYCTNTPPLPSSAGNIPHQERTDQQEGRLLH